MRPFIQVFIIICTFIIFTIPTNATEIEQLKIAFVRDNDLWIKMNGQEKQITKDAIILNPKWSHDGSWLAFTKEKDEQKLVVYNIENNNFEEIAANASNFQWSPVENKLAFVTNNVLNITDVHQIQETKFENVALGVGNFSWHPKGQEFLVSSVANLLPIGWTNIELFTVPTDAKMDQEKVKHIYTLPDDIFAVMTSSFKWSEDRKWISFIAIPTASIAMDMNHLCVLSNDGKTFQNLGEMLYFDDWFQWAPFANRIAFIEGEGRFVVKNKHLMINEFPVHQSLQLTPSGFTERGFSWIDGVNLVVSRAKESEWSNDPKKRPQPQLFHINLITNKQKQITFPKQTEGDYMPIFLRQTKKLVWIRDSHEDKATLLIADQFGEGEEILIEDLGNGILYEDSEVWSKIISIYE